MGSSERARYLLTSSYALHGLVTFIPDLLKECTQIYLIQGAPGTGKATLIRSLGEELLQKGYELEFWLSAKDPSSFDGWYLPARRIAAVNGSIPLISQSFLPASAQVKVIDLNQMLKGRIEAEQETAELWTSLESQQQKTAAASQTAEAAAELLESEYEPLLNKDKVNDTLKFLLQELTRQRVMERHYFATVMTPEGKIDYTDEISRGCKRRYLLTGSMPAEYLLLQELAKEVKKRGFALEYYHDGIQENRLRMILILELRLAVVAAGETAVRHRPGDVIVGLNGLYQPQLTDSLEAINCNQRGLALNLLQVTGELAKEVNLQKCIEKRYTEAMNFTLANQLKAALMEELLR